MRRFALCLTLLLALPPTAASAQRRAQPNLLLTIFGGLTTGSPLWVVGHQPLSLIQDPTLFDTLRLTRALEPGVSLGASAAYFSSPHFGITGEIFFMGLGLDDGCRLIYRAPPADTLNLQTCEDISEHGGSASTVAFAVGAVYRFSPRGFAAPYLRAQGGLTARSISTVEMVGMFTDADGNTQTRLVVADPHHHTLFPTLSAGLGVLVPVSAGYQVGLEIRDNLLFLQAATGPSTVFAETPTKTVLKHGFSFLVRFDIVLEHKRGRRY
jgi:hypothetical protein